MEKTWIKIPDVLFFQEGPGVRKNQYTTEGVKLLNVANLVDGKIDLSTSDRYISEDEAYGKYSHFLCDEGDFIVASSGIKVEYVDKKMGFVEKSMLPLCMNTSTIRFKVLNNEQLTIKYFMYYLKSNVFKQQLFKHITGSAQLNYGPSHLKKMTMPLVKMDEQKAIVDKLDKIQTIIDSYYEELIKLDELIKSRFVEMFGDPNINDRNWGKGTIKDIGKCVAGATPSTKVVEYWEKGTIPWMSSGEVNKERVSETDAMITQLGYENASTKLVPPKTVVIAMAGQGKTRGTAAITEIELCTNQSLCSIVNNERVNPYYLLYFLKMQYDNLRRASTNTDGRGGLNLKIISNFSILIPPIELQNNFESFVESIDKLKVEVQNSLDKTQMLFDSLMQEYFG